MQLPDRLGAYGLIGAFFWVLEIMVLITSGGVPSALRLLQASAQSPLANVPDSLQTLVATMLGLLTIAGVFFTGLLLDLGAAYFTILEMGIFKRHMDYNARWLSDLLSTHTQSDTNDRHDLQARYGDLFSKEEWAAGFDLFLFWKRERRQRWKEAVGRGWGRWKLLKPYNRLSSFLLSYVAVMSGSSQLTLLLDQIYQWRVGRAVSTALLVVYMQATLSGVLFDQLVFRSITWTLVPLLLMGLAFAITMATYSRVCYTLFSLAFVTKEKQARSGIPQEPV